MRLQPHRDLNAAEAAPTIVVMRRLNQCGRNNDHVRFPLSSHGPLVRFFSGVVFPTTPQAYQCADDFQEVCRFAPLYFVPVVMRISLVEHQWKWGEATTRPGLCRGCRVTGISTAEKKEMKFNSPLFKTLMIGPVFLCIVAFLIPFGIFIATRQRIVVDMGTVHYGGLIPFTLGACVSLWCVKDFVVRGRGTPAPFDPPARLVPQGPYQYVRNPLPPEKDRTHRRPPKRPRSSQAQEES